MKTIRYIQLLLLFGAFLILHFPTHAQNTDDTLVSKISKNDLIHPGDLIDVDILGSNEFDWRGTLTPEGNLDGLDFVDTPVYALCMTAEEVEKKVAEAYSKLLREPKVKVRILDRSNRPLATIFGAVKSEQRFQLKRPVLLNELIVLSGGFTDKSSGVIQIFRSSGQSCVATENTEPENADGRERFVRTSQTEGTMTMSYLVTDLLNGKYNPQILSGDIITVLKANPIYIIGGVVNPTSISSREKMTLSRTIASAGGFTKDAETDKITIFRRNGISTDIIEADFEKIKSGNENDIILQDFDIVEVGVKGQEKNKFPPVIEKMDLSSKTIAGLPLRVID
jgi:protein involved in polysaccharide export with SLBB domain